MDQQHEAHLCEHALSDDVYAFLGEPIFGCNPECYGKAAYGKCCYADECFDYSLELVNLGEPLSRVSVGRDPDGGSLACICHNVKSPEKDLATDDVYSENVRFSFFTGADTCSFSSDYAEYSKLWINIEVLPGRFCDFDTLGFSDPPPLSKFKRTKPLITSVHHPAYIYSNSRARISAVVRDDKGIPSVDLNRKVSVEFSPNFRQQLMSCTQSGLKYECSLDAMVESDHFRIRAVDTDGLESVNDNDQQYYSITAVQDALKGKDASDNESKNPEDVIDITEDFFLGECNLDGYFVYEPEFGINDYIDVYKFDVHDGDKINYWLASDDQAYISLLISDDPGDIYIPSVAESMDGFHCLNSGVDGVAILKVIKKSLPVFVIPKKLISYSFGVTINNPVNCDEASVGDISVMSTDEGTYFEETDDEGHIIGKYVSGKVRLGVSAKDKAGFDIWHLKFSVPGSCDLEGFEFDRFTIEDIPPLYSGIGVGIARSVIDDGCVIDVRDYGGQVYLNTHDITKGELTVNVLVEGEGGPAGNELILTIDNTPPEAWIMEPGYRDQLHGMVDLKADVDEYGSGLEDISWYIGDTKIGSGEDTVWGAYGLEGTHYLKLIATDKVENMEEDSIPVVLKSPDLSVSGVTVSDPEPDVRESIMITAEIRNEGNLEANEVNVTFSDGEVIHSEIVSLSSGGHTDLSAEWSAAFGTDRVSVIADPNNDVIESDEGNNIESAEVDVGPGLEDNCGGIVNCGFEDDYLCDCGLCGESVNIDMESSIYCTSLDVENDEHALYRFEATGNAAAYLISDDSYRLYIAKETCSGDRAYKIENAERYMLGGGVHYVEVRKVRDGSDYFEFYISTDEDLDGMPDSIDSAIIISECSRADTDGDNNVTLSEIVDFIILWDNGVVDLSEVVDAITKWDKGCGQAAPPLSPQEADDTLAVASRTTPESAYPGTTITVTLDVEIDETNVPPVIVVSEDIPLGWEVVDSDPEVSHIVYSRGEVDWLFSDAVGRPVEDTSITYTLEIPWDHDSEIGRIMGWIFYMDQGMYVDTVTGFSDIEMLSYECTSGPCCYPVTHTYRNPYYICDMYHEVDLDCPWGSEKEVGIKYKLRHCSGTSSACDGVISGWSNWEVYEDCYDNEYCSDGYCIRGCPPEFERVDLNDDHEVDMGDLFAITKSEYWGCHPDCGPGYEEFDLNDDGAVDMGDLFAVTKSGFWGEECYA